MWDGDPLVFIPSDVHDATAHHRDTKVVYHGPQDGQAAGFQHTRTAAIYSCIYTNQSGFSSTKQYSS